MITDEMRQVWYGSDLSFDVDEADKKIQRIIELHEKSKWISVKDRLPKPDGSHVIVRNSTNAVNGFYTCSQQSVRPAAFNRQGITHWQPLPTFKE